MEKKLNNKEFKKVKKDLNRIDREMKKEELQETSYEKLLKIIKQN